MVTPKFPWSCSKYFRIFPEFLLFLIHQWPYEFNKPQWPYHGLSYWVFLKRHFTTGHQWQYHGLIDWVKKNPVYETVVWSLTITVGNVLEKKMKKPGLRDRGLVTGRLGQKPDWKKMAWSVRWWYGLKKNGLVCQMVIWSLAA